MSNDKINQFIQAAYNQPTIQQSQQYLSLDLETRLTVPTATAAHHLNRKCQTLRMWACLENGPIRPMRICGRLAWPVAEIRKLLNQEAAC